MSGQIQRRFMAHSYLYTCPAASLVRAPFQIGGFKSAINVRYSSLLSDPMIFAISDRFCSRNGGGGVRERKGNLLGKREKPLVCPPDVNQQSERERNRQTTHRFRSERERGEERRGEEEG